MTWFPFTGGGSGSEKERDFHTPSKGMEFRPRAALLPSASGRGWVALGQGQGLTWAGHTASHSLQAMQRSSPDG